MSVLPNAEKEKLIEHYNGYPLIQSMLREESTRNDVLNKEGSCFANSIKGNGSWMRTLFVFRERAFDVIFIPWLLITLNAILWMLILEYGNLMPVQSVIDPWLSVYPLILTTCLAFLLVFRLNRVAVRWWDTRRMWGVILEQARILVSGIMEHMNHSPKYRDRAVAWTCAFVIGSKVMLRGDNDVSEDELAGILSKEEFGRLRECIRASQHPGLYAASEIRHALKLGYAITESTPAGQAVAWSSEMRQLERSVASLIQHVGGMERVKNTPLPIIYTTHLRTFLFVFLLVMPYIYGHVWGWGTIPGVSLVGYALLGIEGAATECEVPFKKNRVNHLAMEVYCLTALKNILQLLMHAADMRMRDEDHSEKEDDDKFVVQDESNGDDMV